ncbi:GYDIA family GHMP kinase [Costertonia aggregata]|uniref:GHMP kinase n=1 Tax=Costertonia aggregata TaxID=343403 RepID=A0A7H9ARD2_9FLAO|nr:GYDIA family GHMP kinase [Costertonia aggregata]QLG45795.1 GHMP kinase [Costertonia aggregata]
MKEFYSNGKLLLTGEYAVLDGALSLGLPTKYGQHLKVSENHTQQIIWKSLDDRGNVWFEGIFETNSLREIASSDTDISRILAKILTEANTLNTSFLKNTGGCTVETKLNFPRDWGLGSSSTLINNVAQWANIDAYTLLRNAFSGSGYDVACAKHDTPITYQLINSEPIVEKIAFYPSFRDSLFFVYLNKKQNSREGIAKYKNQAFDTKKLVTTISEITSKVILCKELSEFEELMLKHEKSLSQILNIPNIKESLFSDYQDGAIKSLGAWGGDFILATGNEKTPEYFKSKGFMTIVPYSEMILPSW